MPSALVARAGVSPDQQAFWTSILLICETATAFAACPIFGLWVDSSAGRRVPFLIGLVWLAAAMAFFTAARSTTMYIVGRILQGLASAIVDVAGLALLRDGVGNDRLGEGLGYAGTGRMVGLVAGPPLGGLVDRAGGYYAVCILGFVIVAVDAVMRLAVVEKEKKEKGGEQSAVQMQEGVDAAGVEESDRKSTTTASNTPAESEPKESKTRVSFAMWKLLKQPRVVITLWALGIDGLIIGACDATLPTYVEKLFGWDAFAAGLLLLAMAVPALLEPWFGRLCDRFGVRILAVLGFAMHTPTLVCLQFVTQDSISHKVLLAALLALCGLSLCVALPALYMESQIVVEEMEEHSPGIFGKQGAVSQAFALQTMANYAGLSVGPIIGENMLSRYGWKPMTWTLGALAGVTILPVFYLSHESLRGEEQTEGEQTGEG
ncbi:putative MFS transporter [Aspergillus campestris IBT 28561]|uniref:MFS transporter n=1 Tax=Aspergillus campestris (strain IBT 28561) TaxID=1392248 RepID=A0A2I1D6C7_ASPC2|nr:putative MFS transporter [Aspergillus campestris IBT 28561]PKY05441.1 putative MFS transporter [Aspergillus campestris IBT 28561]